MRRPSRRRRSPGECYLFALTPAGAGFLSLFSPGLLVAAVTRQTLLIALSVGAGMMLAANAVAARLAVRGVVVRVRAPGAATAGSAVPIRVALDARHPVECVVGVDGATRPWISATVPATGDVPVVLERGVVQRIGIRIQSAVPFGLTAWMRSVPAPLDRPLHVGPPAVPVVLPVRLAARSNEAASGADPAEPAGLREYAVGDPLRDVHWPAVARTGRLVVKDRCRIAAVDSVAVALHVAGEDGEDGEVDDVLGRARSALEQLLATGYLVYLTTVERAGDTSSAGPPAGPGRISRWAGRRSPPPVQGTVTVTGPVRSRQAINMRLALACAGRPDEGGAASRAPSRAAVAVPSQRIGAVRAAPAQLVITTDGLWWRSPG